MSNKRRNSPFERQLATAMYDIIKPEIPATPLDSVCDKCGSDVDVQTYHKTPLYTIRRQFLKTISPDIIPTKLSDGKISDRCFNEVWKDHHQSSASYIHLCAECGSKKCKRERHIECVLINRNLDDNKRKLTIQLKQTQLEKAKAKVARLESDISELLNVTE